MKIKKAGSFISMLLFAVTAYSQDTIVTSSLTKQHSFVKFIAKTNLSREKLLLITMLRIDTKNDSVEVAKDRQFDQGSCYDITPYFSGQVFLEKQIQNTFVNITTNRFSHAAFNSDYGSKQTVTFSTPVQDTINLGALFPFEAGKYRIRTALNYFYNGIKYTATSNICLFKVQVAPLSSEFN